MAKHRQIHIFLIFMLLWSSLHPYNASGQDNPASEAKLSSESYAAAEYSVAKQPGTGVQVSCQIALGSVKVGNNTIPTWKVEVTVANYTDRAVRLGESMAVLEKLPTLDEMVGIYIARESRYPTGHLNMMPLRYGLLWGATVGTASPGFWPLAALPGGSALNSFDILMLSLSLPSVKPYYPDGGYPSVGAGQQALIREEILVPIKVDPQDALLLPPFVLEEGKAPVQTVFRFDVSSRSGAEQGILPTDTKEYLLNSVATAQLPGDTTQPVWLRLHALNWLAESNFDESVAMLLGFAEDQSAPRAMRNAALLNLGLHQYKPAISIMLAHLNNKTNPLEQAIAIAALGETGDSSVAAHLRPLLNDSNEMLAIEAIEAVGKLKDSESVGVLLGALANRKKEKQYSTIIKSLVQIGSPAAWSGLLTVVGDRHSGFQARRSAALALGSAQYGPAVPILSKVLADEREDESIRLNMISALESIGGPEAWAAVRSACATRKKSVAERSLRSMASSKDSTNKAFVIEIAGISGHTLRAEAIEQINWKKIAGAGPTLKAAIHDPSIPAELLPEALSALIAIGEKVDPDDLVPLWSAYQKEKDSSAGSRLAEALIKGKFNDKTAIPFLVAGLDEGKNKLWFANIEILRHLTGQTLGPEYAFSGDKKSRKADFDKWREWWAQQPK